MQKLTVFGGITACFMFCSFLYAANNAANKSANATPPVAAPSTQAMPNTPALSDKPIDCTYKIPAEQTTIEQSLVLKWGEKATLQTFTLSSKEIDQQLASLKPCFTDQGWQSFNDALQKSGNLAAIKTQNLNLSSSVNGTPTLSEIKNNQWKLSMPLNVMYQNDKEKFNQLLNVDVLIGRKLTGELGIMQVIAAPDSVKKPKEATKALEGAVKK